MTNLRTWRGPLTPIVLGIGIAAVIYLGGSLLDSDEVRPRAAVTASSAAAPAVEADPGSRPAGPRPPGPLAGATTTGPTVAEPVAGAPAGAPADAPAVAGVTPTPWATATTIAAAVRPNPPATMPDLSENETTEAAQTTEATRTPIPPGQFPYVQTDVVPDSPCSYPDSLGLTTDRKTVVCTNTGDGDGDGHRWQLPPA